jgi:PAS domain S-box-containing protein
MIVAGPDGIIQFANVETERLFGYPAVELIGKSIDILVPTAMRQRHASLRQSFYADPSKRPMGVGRDLKGTRRDRSEVPVEIGLTPIETETGLVVLATVLDISGRLESEAILAQRAAELEKANERLAQFAYVASHDLQEPLRKIAVFANLQERAIAASNQSEVIHANTVMRNAALRARELVDDLLTYSRMINDAQQLQELDLHDEIERAVADLSEAISEAKADVKISARRSKFLADRSQFARLIQNIVSNAIKYHKPDHPPKIAITTESPKEGMLCIAIVDEGIGFEAKYAAMIFEPFKRLHSRAKYPGTGIGLAICKSIADRHGWDLAIDSAPGQGATFSVTVPTIR